MNSTTSNRPPRASQTSTRREFLKFVAATSGAAIIAAQAPAALGGEQENQELADVNVNLGRWPVRRLPCDEPGRLVAKLRSRGVSRAWAGSFDGLLHKDLGAVNARLADDCQRHGRGLLLPFGSVNPKLPGWEKDFQRCLEVHHMRGLRLHPNYHGYRLDDPAFARLLKLAAEHRLIVQLALLMEDERMMHPRLRAEPVDPAPLAQLAGQIPGLRLMLINALGALRGQSLRELITAGDICVEISMLEGVGGIGGLLEQVPAERILFGSHAPLFYFEAAALKLRESLLTPEQRRAICQGNAKRLLA
ncbi:MAG: amidohydrolase family protein [Verrucomicrobiota bacterium]